MGNKGGRRQRGVVAIAVLTMFVLGGAWFAIDALTKAASSTAVREARTGAALKAAKEAVLAHVAGTAASSTELYPGRLPCPEVLSQSGTANAGYAGPFTGIPCDAVGRLPWRTLGIDQLTDGYGEPLWYAVPTGTWAWTNLNDALIINPGTANALTYDGASNAVVAVIIAPGPPLAKSGVAPAGCSTLNQLGINRYSSLAIANFLECGNATASYRSSPQAAEVNVPKGDAPWSNDRTIAITAREVMDAISGAVADRMQRQVAPALSEYRTTTSLSNWGRSFLPYASTFNTTPAANDLCGDSAVTEGTGPFTPASSCTPWTNGSVASVLGTLTGPSCSSNATGMRCTFTGLGAGILGTFRVNVTVTGANVSLAFREAINAGDITVLPWGTASSFSTSVNSSGVATTTFQLQTTFLWGASAFTVDIPHPPAAGLLSDARVKWFIDNGWQRYSYYAISQAVSVNPGSSTCPAAGGAECLTLSGLPADNGLSNDKAFILALAGNAVTTSGGYAQAQPSSNYLDYLESHTTGTSLYARSTVNSNFNDRFATCPFRHTRDAGTTITLC